MLEVDCYDWIICRLERVRTMQNGALKACCPSHHDRHPSLSVRIGRQGNLLLKCHANRGCTIRSICQALGVGVFQLWPNNEDRRIGPVAERKIDAIYDYCDEHGEVLYQTIRYLPKDFCQRQPDGQGGWKWSLDGVRRLPYRLPDLLTPLEKGETIYLAEGEKTVDALWRHALVPATCNECGAGKWTEAHSAFFTGARVVLLPDHDESGRRHAAQVAGGLLMAGCKLLSIVSLPGLEEHGDFVNWLAAFRLSNPKAGPPEVRGELRRLIGLAGWWEQKSGPGERGKP